MIRGILAVWLAAFGAAAFSIFALLSVPPDVRALGRSIPEAEVYFIGTSLVRNAVPPSGMDVLYDGMGHIRLAFPSMTEGLTLDLAEAAIATGRVKAVAIEAYPFVRDFRDTKVGEAERGVLEKQASAMLASALDVKAAVRALAPRIGIGTALMQQSIDDRAVELPSKINTEALRRLYPLHIRAPSDMERLMRLVDTAHSRGVEIWLLAPPRSETASKLIGPNGKERLSEAVKQLASKLGCRLFSPAHFWPDNLFTDQAHLNIEGRARFLAELKAAAKEQL